ncbi:MAG: helix-turn-helix transcriptional regulator [Desulfosporosinus sp.]|nr:helix-turn-helix transcriptional regulator [Desulfosporosinus sp.]
MRDKLIGYRGTRSQENMAAMYGVTQQAWSKWEKSGSAPCPAMMKQIANDSGIPMEELFFDIFNNHKLLKSDAARERDDTDTY